MDMNEKLTPSQKAGIQKALGPDHSNNKLRKTSKSARELINLVKNHAVKKDKEKVEQIDEISGDFLARASDLAQKRKKPEQAARLGAQAYARGISSDFMKNRSRFADTQRDRDNRMKTAEEVEQFDEILKASDSVGKWIDDFTHSKDPKFNGKSKEERRKMALGAYYGAQKESYENSTEELAEGRGRPPKEGSKAWHAAQSKASSKEGSDQEADKNIVNQMRKKPVGDSHHLVFSNGEKKNVHVRHVNKALSMLANTPKPVERQKLQNSLGHSHKRFMDTVSSGKAIEDAPKQKITLGKMKTEAVETSDNRPEKAYVENGKVVMKKLPRKIMKIEDLDPEVLNTLNNLYLSLSESNKEIFLEKMTNDHGVSDLILFAAEQGI